MPVLGKVGEVSPVTTEVWNPPSPEIESRSGSRRQVWCLLNHRKVLHFVNCTCREEDVVLQSHVKYIEKRELFSELFSGLLRNN